MQSKRASDEDQTSGRKRLKVYQNIQPQNNLAEGESDFENNTDDAFIDDDNDDNDELESRTLNIDQFRKENIDTNSEIDDAIRESDSAFTLESFDIKEDLKKVAILLDPKVEAIRMTKKMSFGCKRVLPKVIIAKIIYPCQNWSAIDL